MSHVVVGERLAGVAPELIGHVVAGAGHFVEVAGGFVQQFSQSGNIVPMIARGNINDLSNAVALENWQWNNLQQNYGTGSLLAASDHESTAAEQAWKDSIERSFEKMLDASKDVALSVGSYVAGDLENAVSYGASAAEKFFESMFNIGPGHGTCPLPGEGRP